MMAAALQNGPDTMATTTLPSPADPTKDSHASATPRMTSHPLSPPFIHIEGLANLRDMGGYPCQPPNPPFAPQKSYIIRPFTLFRSAQLTSITPTGTTALSQHLKIRKLYDLRSDREIPNPTKDHIASTAFHVVQRIHVPVFRDEDYSPEGLARKYKNYTSPDQDASHGYSAGFVRAYRDILANAGPAYRRIFDHILNCDIPHDEEGSRPEPLLFHCAAGKDRTGVFAALVMRLCGVADEVIAWEYSITERGLGPWKEVMMAHMMKGGEPGSGTPAMTRAEAERAVGSRAKNMIVFLGDVLDGEFGGVEKYLLERCELNGKEVESLRRRLVVEGESVFGDGTGYWKATSS